jgi:hypothetical protein
MLGLLLAKRPAGMHRSAKKKEAHKQPQHVSTTTVLLTSGSAVSYVWQNAQALRGRECLPVPAAPACDACAACDCLPVAMPTWWYVVWILQAHTATVKHDISTRPLDSTSWWPP